jgi:mono/diheme cytochrome c family protein
MRYWLAILASLGLLVLTVAGLRGGLSRHPPIELFADMVRQPKLRPQTRSDFFTNRLGSGLPVEGAVARGAPFQDTPLNTGRLTGTTNFAATNPLPITGELLARGRDRFQILCWPCHGAQADGRGITTSYGLAVIANLHDPRIVRLLDGELFNTVSKGKNMMQSYAASLSPAERWAVIAYLRALQLSHLATLDDVPTAHRSALVK